MSPRAERYAPALLAAALGLAYVIVSPPSLDLAAHLLRAKLWSAEGFGLWNNWWYSGHHTPGYSVLFPPLAALLSPQIVGALAGVGTAIVFAAMARARFGRDAWLGALWFGAATAVDLGTGRLTFAFGLLPAFGAALALERRRDGVATGLAVITALASPVAALFAALAAVACAIHRLAGERRSRALVAPLLVVAAALVPVLILNLLFPEGGTEPFSFATLWPLLILCAVALIATPSHDVALRAGIALFTVGCLAAYVIPSPVGSNAARLGPLLGGPIAALLWWPKRKLVLALAALPLLYLQWQAPFRDLNTSSRDPTTSPSYFRPLLSFLERQPGGPFRIEIPFTKFHWEAYVVAPEIPLARGWERQLDIEDNAIFYGHDLNATTYRAWLHRTAVRYVALAASRQDYSAHAEAELIDDGLPYLHLVMHTRHWRVYAVAHPTPIAQGPVTLTRLSGNSLTLAVHHPGTAHLSVHFTPYWKLTGVPGCVIKEGTYTGLRLRAAGTAQLVISFALGRIRASAPRCT